MAEVISSDAGTAGPSLLVGPQDRERRYPISGNYFERIRQLVCERWDSAQNHYRAKFEQFYRYEKLIDMVSK